MPHKAQLRMSRKRKKVHYLSYILFEGLRFIKLKYVKNNWVLQS